MQIKGKNRAQDTVEQEIKDNLDNLPDAGEDAEEAEDDDEDKSTLHGSKRYEVKWMKEWTPVLHRVVERARRICVTRQCPAKLLFSRRNVIMMWRSGLHMNTPWPMRLVQWRQVGGLDTFGRTRLIFFFFSQALPYRATPPPFLCTASWDRYAPW